MSPRDGQTTAIPNRAAMICRGRGRRGKEVIEVVEGVRNGKDLCCSYCDCCKTGATVQDFNSNSLALERLQPHHGWNSANNRSYTDYGIDQDYIADCFSLPSCFVLRWNVRQALAPGNNFASTMLRVRVMFAGNSRPTSFMVKTLPEGEMRTIVQDIGMWQKEKTVYEAIVPRLRQVLGCRVAPRTLPSPNSTDICLEDLHESGYRSVDKREQLDFDHSVVALKALAKFHAGSVVVRDLDKENFDYVGEELTFKETSKEASLDFMRTPFKYLANELDKSKTLKKYSKGVRDFGDLFFDLAIEAAKPKGVYNVLNHGDFWTNNILFRYDEGTGQVKRAKIVDFQNCRYTTPAHDLQYFFMSSVAEDVRENRLDDLVKIYLEYLNEQLAVLELKPFSEEDLRQDLEATECYAFYAATSVLATAINDPEEITVDNDFNGNPFVKCMKGRKYRRMIPNILTYFDKKGLFRRYMFNLADEISIKLS